MAQFQYHARNTKGNIVKAELQAENEREAIKRLRQQHLIPLKIKSIKSSKTGSGKRIKQGDLIDFYEGLATLMKAAVPIDRALVLLESLTEHPALKEMVASMRREVKEGKSLADTMEARSHIFSRMMISMIRAGEEGGILDQLLPELVEFMRDSEDTKRQAVSALIYPAILFLVGIISVVLLLVFVVPRFTTIFENAGSDIPDSAQFLMGLSAWLQNYSWMGIVFVVAIIAWWQSLKRKASTRIQRDGWLLKLPVLGSLLLLQNAAHFARTLSALLKAGIPLINALMISRGVMENEILVEDLKIVEKEVRAGKSLGLALQKFSRFPLLLHQLVIVGEESGRTSQVLAQVAHTYDREVKKRVTRLVALLEPLLILFLGLFVGGIVVTMLSAVFSINDIGM